MGVDQGLIDVFCAKKCAMREVAHTAFCKNFSIGMPMANLRLSMRKSQDVLRLHFASDRSNREITAALSIGRTTVNDYLRHSNALGL